MAAVRWLLSAGMDPDIPNHGEGRPIHAAAANGQAEAAKCLLLEGGAAHSLQNSLGETARDLAAQARARVRASERACCILRLPHAYCPPCHA